MKSFFVKFLAQAAPSVLAWALSLAVPVIPAPVWLALIKGLLAGDLTLEHIAQFLKDHNIKTYSEPSDFPDAPPGQTNQHNFTVGENHENP